MRQLGDFPMLEILLASDNPAQQNGRIDRRHLRIPHSLAGIYIRPVIEESSVIGRSEEHTSELQSRLHLVCRLLLEKKKHYTRALLPTLRASLPCPARP